MKDKNVEIHLVKDKKVKVYEIEDATVWLLCLQEISDVDFERMYVLCSRERKEKVDKIKSEIKRKQSVGAGYLISLLKEQFSIAEEPIILSEGKPVFSETQKIYFSISHSKDIVVLAFGKSPLGVDIEYIKQANLKIAKRFFTKEEYDHLLEQDEEKQGNVFCRMWTGKEAVVKAVGSGLSLPLDSFSVLNKIITVSGKLYELHWKRFVTDGFATDRQEFWLSVAQLIKDHS